METNAAGVETFALPDPEAIEESSIDALPHSQPKISPAYDASTMVRVGESGNIQNAAQEAGFTIGDAPDGLTEAEREEKKKQDEEFHEALSGALEEQKERQERERQEAHAKEWDKAMHDFGGQQVQGSVITAAYDYYKKNREKIIEQMIADGKSRQQAEDLARILDERARIWEKMRLGTATQEEIDYYTTSGQREDVKQEERNALNASQKGIERDAVQKNAMSNKQQVAFSIDAIKAQQEISQEDASDIRDGMDEQLEIFEKQRAGVATKEELAAFQELTKTTENQQMRKEIKTLENSPLTEQPNTLRTSTEQTGYTDFPSAPNVGRKFESAANGNTAPEATIPPAVSVKLASAKALDMEV